MISHFYYLKFTLSLSLFQMPKIASLDVYCTSQHELTDMQDSSYQELAGFLDAVERHGTGVLSSIDGAQRQTASEEARLLKAALLRLRQ